MLISSAAAVPSHSRSAVFARVVLLPLALIVATIAGLGSYYEASDDASLGWLFSGVLALKPVTSVPLYFHGYGHLLAAAYTAAPGVPWLGLLLSGLLGLATIFLFAVLDGLLRPYLRPVPLALALSVFFGVALVEHWLWFSYVRVALLLAGAALLFAAQRPGRAAALLIGFIGFAAAWLLRPSLAALAFGATLPAVLALAGHWRRAVPVVAGAAIGLALATGAAALLRTPAETRTQVRDGYFARVLDFDQLRPQPHTPADSLGTAAINLWLMGDSTVVNEALCRRAYRFDAADFLVREVPAKLSVRVGLLLRDYFPLLLAIGGLMTVVARRPGSWRWFWLVQGGFAGGLVLFAGILKLPPRLALALLDFWLLANLAFWLMPDAVGGKLPEPQRPMPAVWRYFGVAAALGVGLLYGAKTWHRHEVLLQEQRRHQLALKAIDRAGHGRIRILAGANDLLKSLSPFRTYAPGPGPLLMLTGWPSHDASQSRLRLALSGTTDQTECLRRLAAIVPYGPRPVPLWVLSPETAHWLSRRFRLAGGPPLMLYPESGQSLLRTDSTLHIYYVRPWPEH